MENNFNIEVKEAFLVTKDNITTVQAFTMSKVGSYGGTIQETYYLTEKGWKQSSSYTWSGENVCYTQKDADDKKREMMSAHLEYLRKNKRETEDQIANMENQLAK